MLKQLAGCVREYKRPTILTLIFIVGEAVIETIIPFITANLVNRIKAGASIESVMEVGLLLIIMQPSLWSAAVLPALPVQKPPPALPRTCGATCSTASRLILLRTSTNSHHLPW